MAKGTALAKASVCWSNRNEATEAKTGKGEGEGGRDEVTGGRLVVRVVSTGQTQRMFPETVTVNVH